MNEQERMSDIYENEDYEFCLGEVEHEFANNFRSIEFNQIIHLSNEEHYYVDEETIHVYTNMADTHCVTPHGYIYCFK